MTHACTCTTDLTGNCVTVIVVYGLQTKPQTCCWPYILWISNKLFGFTAVVFNEFLLFFGNSKMAKTYFSQCCFCHLQYVDLFEYESLIISFRKKN